MKSTGIQRRGNVACWRGASAGTPQRIVGAVALTVLAALLPRFAAADTVLAFNLGSGSVLAGSASNPPSAFCALTSNCPSTPTFGLSTSEPLAGTVSFDLTTDTMTFDLALTQNATFGSLTVYGGSSFAATSAAVDVSSSGHGAGTTYLFTPGATAATLSANLLLSSGFTETAAEPTIPGIECVASAAGGSCSLLIGTPLAGAGALQIAQGGTTYDGVMSISANLTPVPLPSSAMLMLGGLGLLVARGRRAATPGAIRDRSAG
jgi:hypothetical protein